MSISSQKKKELERSRMDRYGITAAGIKEGESLEHAYRRLAKQADQRLKRLEYLASGYSDKGKPLKDPENWKGVLSYSYGKAIKDIESYSGEGATRFNTAPPETEKLLRAKINDMINFLNSPTSTKGGITKVYIERTNTLNKKYPGLNLTWQEAGRFFEQKKDKVSRNRDSDKILKAIAKLRAPDSKIRRELEESKGKYKIVSEEEVNDAIYDFLEKNDIDASLLFDDEAPGTMYKQAPEESEEKLPKPKRASTAKKRTKASKKTSKSKRSATTYKKRDYTGKTIAQIIRAVGRGLTKSGRSRR